MRRILILLCLTIFLACDDTPTDRLIIRGVVINGDSKEPMSNVKIKLSLANSSATATRGDSTNTDKNGIYTFFVKSDEPTYHFYLALPVDEYFKICPKESNLLFTCNTALDFISFNCQVFRMKSIDSSISRIDTLHICETGKVNLSIKRANTSSLDTLIFNQLIKTNLGDTLTAISKLSKSDYYVSYNYFTKVAQEINFIFKVKRENGLEDSQTISISNRPKETQEVKFEY